MTITEAVFWGSLFLIAYGYFLYALVLGLGCFATRAAREIRGRGGSGRSLAKAWPPADELPPVSLIFPAYNEEAHLEEKIANTRQLDYPADKLEVLIVSDGSTDRTNEILKAAPDPNFRTIFLPQRGGKFNALNRAVSEARHDIFLFCDATTLFPPGIVRLLVRHFADPRIGVAAGALQFQGTAEYHGTQGIYWKFEALLRRMEGRLGLTITASGANYALRRVCYRFLTANDAVEDCLIPMHARGMGYKVVYDPEAVGSELAASSVRNEFGRKVRFAVGGFGSLPSLLGAAARSSPKIAFAFLSHKLLRWIAPFFFAALLASNAALLEHPFYRCTFIAQLLFYFWAGAGFIFRERMKTVRFALIGYFVVAMNIALAVGFFRFLAGREEAIWQRAE
ncbi:MAG: glycosyltransferase family 2 protein [Terriglobia bacterium]